MSHLYSPVFVPSPRETIVAMVGLLRAPENRTHVYSSFYRILLSLTIMSVTSIALGVMSGFNPWIQQLLKPLKDILLAIPPVALSLLVIFIFGVGTVQTVTIAVMLAFPLLYGAVLSAVRSVDRDMLEMLRAFEVGKTLQLREAYLPAVLSAVMPSMVLAAGLTVRLMIMAEIIVGMGTGIGHALSLARVHMATDDIFAWMIVMIVAVLTIEGGLLYLVKKYLLTWQAGR